MPSNLSKPKAQLFYDFEFQQWEIRFPSGRSWYGDTPKEAIEAAARECNKHDLWNGDET